MKFLIENYAGYDSTQALYFHKHINDYEEHSCVIRPNNVSLFDSFDMINPDVYISSANKLSKDALLYIKQNQDKDIKLVICVDGLSADDVQSLDDVIKKNGVNCHFFFTSGDISSKIKTRIVQIRNGADINLEPSLKIDYNIEKAIFVNSASNIRNYGGTFHVISCNPNFKDSADFYLPITMLSSIYDRYEEIIFTEIRENLSQCFFDAIYRGKRVYYDILDEGQSHKADEIINSALKVGNSLNYNNPNRLMDFENIKKYIKEKNSSINRTKTLLSQLPQKVKKDA